LKRFGCTGALALFFISAVVVSMLAGSGAPGSGGARDVTGRGHLALVLMMRELGFDVGVFTGSPKQLAESEVELVVLLRVPDMDAEETGSFAPSWYADYIARGGDLVVPVASWDELEFLREGLGLEHSEVDLSFGESGRDWAIDVPLGGGLSGGEELALETHNESLLEIGVQPGSGVQIWSAARGDGTGGSLATTAAAVIVPRGAGRLVLLGAPSAFENKLLVEADNGLFFVRLIEALEASKESRPRLDFDQAAVTRLEDRSWVVALFQLPLLPATLSVLFAVCLGAWSLSARRSFPLDRRLARRPPPSERARAVAGLVGRAGHPEWLTTDQPQVSTDTPNHD